MKLAELLAVGLAVLRSLSARSVPKMNGLKELKKLPENFKQTTHVLRHKNHHHARHEIGSCNQHPEEKHWHFKVKDRAGRLVDSGRYCRGEIDNANAYNEFKRFLDSAKYKGDISSYQIHEHEGIEYIVIENPFKNTKGNKQKERKAKQMETFCSFLDVSNKLRNSKMIVMVSAKALANNPNPYMPPSCLFEVSRWEQLMQSGVSTSPFFSEN